MRFVGIRFDMFVQLSHTMIGMHGWKLVLCKLYFWSGLSIALPACSCKYQYMTAIRVYARMDTNHENDNYE